MIRRSLLALSAAFALAAAPFAAGAKAPDSPAAGSAEVVKIRQGALRGTVKDGVE